MAGDKLPLLPPERSSWVDSAFRPLRDFYLWCQVVDQKLRELFNAAADAEDALPGKAGLTQVDDWQHTITKAINGDTVIKQKVPFAGTITNTITDCDSGTCSITTKIDGVALGGSANSVSTTESDVTRSTSNTFTAGQTISYTIASNATCLGARIQIVYTRNLAP